MAQAIPMKTKRRGAGRSLRRLAVALAALFALHNGVLPRIGPLADASPAEAAEVAPSSRADLQMAIRPLEIDLGRAAAPSVVSPVAALPVVELSSPAISFTAPATPARPAVAIWRGSAAPTRAAAKVGELQPGQPVEVVRWVSGEEVEKENTTWADLGGGRFAYSTLLRSQPLSTAPARPEDAPRSGRWIDVNLTLQVATAYDGERPLKSVLVSTGRPGWETPRGTFRIERRVEKETMDGSTLIGQGPNGAGATYKIENVKFTQYFTADGSAIHENTWRNPDLFGLPGSHGCIGMRPSDAAWFWQFATVGTPLVIHP
jgi:lipoprotein-anchoring transpeptidase ErfK/SrfK